MPSVDIQRPYAEPGIPEQYETIREAVRMMEPRDVSRQLPNLVEMIRTHSGEDEPTIRFVIGISFSQNETLFDYMLDRVLAVDSTDQSPQPRYETLKPAVHDNHLYLVFAYPSDPHFDAASLRAALLTAIEDETTNKRSSSSRTKPDGGAEDKSSPLSKLIAHLRLS